MFSTSGFSLRGLFIIPRAYSICPWFVVVGVDVESHHLGVWCEMVACSGAGPRPTGNLEKASSCVAGVSVPPRRWSVCHGLHILLWL